jgi:hypothetical protein
MELLDDAGTIFGAKMRASDGRERIRGLREQICEPTAQWDLTLMHRIDELRARSCGSTVPATLPQQLR